MMQNLSAMQSPPIQVMEKQGDFDSGRISSTPASLSLKVWSSSEDTDETDSKLEVLNGSSTSASKISDVTNETEVQHISPARSSSPAGWSNCSEESLFSIQIGHHSFSRNESLKTAGESFKSEEHDAHGEHTGHRQTSFAPKAGENNKVFPDRGRGAGNPKRNTRIPVQPIKNGVGSQQRVPLGMGADAPNHFVGNRTSNELINPPPITKSEPSGCLCCCAGSAWDCCHCSRSSQCTICSACSCGWLSCLGCSCKWFTHFSFSCKCLSCCCKWLKCQGCCCKWPTCQDCCCKWPKCQDCCCKWPSFSFNCCKLPKCGQCCCEWSSCLNCCSCKLPRCHRLCCCEFPFLNCGCCESISCSCFYCKCPIWRSCRCRLFCCR